MRRPARPAATLLALLASGGAQAHSFGKVYTLPVPFWLYAWAGMATLLLSFLITGWFLTREQALRPARQYSLDLPARPARLFVA
ncbi:MAG: hypothetical protein VW625_06610, partial [Perlucidibaca sp.]